MSEPLGMTMHVQAVTLRGRLDDKAWLAFAREAVECIGMEPAGDPAVWHYPIGDGKGGLGMTICQPMTESHLVIETWPDHDGAYVNIGSCKPFSLHLMSEAFDRFELELLETSARSLLSLGVKATEDAAR